MHVYELIGRTWNLTEALFYKYTLFVQKYKYFLVASQWNLVNVD
jgi:hypothetical protein